MMCMKSELDIFDLPPLQTNVTSVEQVVYNPITSLSNSTSIEFLIPGNGDTYKNLSSIYLRLLIELKANQAELPKEDPASPAKKIGVVNNLLHSLFRQCTVSFNNTQVSQDNDYHYKAFFQTILNYNRDAVSTHLQNSGWCLDEQNLNSLMGAENPKHAERSSWFESTPGNYNKKVEFMGKLHVDLFSQPRYLLNNVDIKITLNKEKCEFYIMEAAQNTSDIKILEANLFIEHVHVNPALLLAHHKMLEKTTSKYPFKRVTVRQHTINAGTSNLCLDNIVIGQKPNILLFAMVSNNAYCGSRNHNPFYLKPFGLQQFALFVDGKQIPGKPIAMQHSENIGNITSRAYQTLFTATGINYADRGHQITKQLFDTCYFMLAFDLTADHSYNSICINPVNQCAIRIEGSFQSNLTEAITCLVVCEFDALMEIDKFRTVAVTL